MARVTTFFVAACAAIARPITSPSFDSSFVSSAIVSSIPLRFRSPNALPTDMRGHAFREPGIPTRRVELRKRPPDEAACRPPHAARAERATVPIVMRLPGVVWTDAQCARRPSWVRRRPRAAGPSRHARPAEQGGSRWNRRFKSVSMPRGSGASSSSSRDSTPPARMGRSARYSAVSIRRAVLSPRSRRRHQWSSRTTSCGACTLTARRAG